MTLDAYVDSSALRARGAPVNGERAPSPFDDIVGEHPSMRRLLTTVEKLARSRATIVIRGETGTGKELIAAAVHAASHRADGPFVRLNCAALAETLLESELFGHERGAFTGAVGQRIGKLELADGGTIFLDEVGELPASVQLKLLRFLQEREIERVGGNDTIPLDVRVVAATNVELEQRVEAGQFRADLYYRLNVVQVRAPALRERRSDIPLLADHFLRRFARENDKHVVGFTKAAHEMLMSYPWPGNVRELENAVERAVVLTDEELIGPDLLPGGDEWSSSDGVVLLKSGATLEEVEKAAILQTLEATGSTSRAAAVLGISRRTIQYRLKRWGLSRPRPGAMQS